MFAFFILCFLLSLTAYSYIKTHNNPTQKPKFRKFLILSNGIFIGIMALYAILMTVSFGKWNYYYFMFLLPFSVTFIFYIAVCVFYIKKTVQKNS